MTNNTEQQAVPVAQELPEVMPGHWSSAAGLAMALATLDDPHMARSRERISDFALANEVFLSPGIANLTDAKERIRWLSASLALALQTDATQTREAELVGFLEQVLLYADPSGDGLYDGAGDIAGVKQNGALVLKGSFITICTRIRAALNARGGA